MSEERLQEIKDSISRQYKVQETNDLDSFNIFTDEEQELVDEIERLNNIIKEAIEYIETKEKDDDNWVDYELLIEPIKIKEILDKEKI